MPPHQGSLRHHFLRHVLLGSASFPASSTVSKASLPPARLQPSDSATPFLTVSEPFPVTVNGNLAADCLFHAASCTTRNHPEASYHPEGRYPSCPPCANMRRAVPRGFKSFPQFEKVAAAAPLAQSCSLFIVAAATLAGSKGFLVNCEDQQFGSCTGAREGRHTQGEPPNRACNKSAICSPRPPQR